MPLDLEKWINEQLVNVSFLEGRAQGQYEMLNSLRLLIEEAHENENLDSVDKRNEDTHPEDGSMDLCRPGAQFPDTGKHSNASSDTEDAGFPNGVIEEFSDADSWSED